MRAKAGARAAVYGAPNALARAYYQAPLQPGQLYPLLGRNRTPWILNPRRTPDEARVYVLDWWQIDVPEYPVAWVIRDQVELVEVEEITKVNIRERVRVPSGTWPDVATTWPAPAAPDARAWYLRPAGGTVNVRRSLTTAAGAANIVGALDDDDGRWREILDRQCAQAAAPVGALKPLTHVWYRVRYSPEGATGWVRGDVVAPRAFLAAGEVVFDDEAAPIYPYLLVNAGVTIRVRPEPNTDRTDLGTLTDSGTPQEIVGGSVPKSAQGLLRRHSHPRRQERGRDHRLRRTRGSLVQRRQELR